MDEAVICLTDRNGLDQWVGGVAGELWRCLSRRIR